MSRIDNEKTLEKYRKMEQLYMNPKQQAVAEHVGINRTILSSFLHGTRELSYENKKKLNLFLDKKIALIEGKEKETV